MFVRFAKWFMAVTWPWVIEHVWPVIQKRLIGIFEKIVKDLGAKFDEWWAGRQNAAQSHAEEKAAQADDMAERCATDADARQYRATAKVWREVAENFRRENEELTAKLNEALARAKSTFVEQLNTLDVGNIIQQTEDGSLMLSGSGTELLLPAPQAALIIGQNGDDRGSGGVEDGMVPIAELRRIAQKLGLQQISDELLCASIESAIEAIMSADCDPRTIN